MIVASRECCENELVAYGWKRHKRLEHAREIERRAHLEHTANRAVDTIRIRDEENPDEQEDTVKQRNVFGDDLDALDTRAGLAEKHDLTIIALLLDDAVVVGRVGSVGGHGCSGRAR